MLSVLLKMLTQHSVAFMHVNKLWRFSSFSTVISLWNYINYSRSLTFVLKKNKMQIVFDAAADEMQHGTHRRAWIVTCFEINYAACTAVCWHQHFTRKDEEWILIHCQPKPAGGMLSFHGFTVIRLQENLINQIAKWKIVNKISVAEGIAVKVKIQN